MTIPTATLSRRLVELACRAPSVHNSQPWRWRIMGDDVVELCADRERQLPVSDPTGRNLALSCGAALQHGVVAAEALGLQATSELVSTDDADLLGRLRLAPGHTTPESLQTLIALEQRCTDRRRFTSWPIPDARLTHLAEAASGWGAFAIPITDVTARFRTEELISRAMSVQATDPAYTEEQADWTDHSGGDGIPLRNAVPQARGDRPTRPQRFDGGAGPTGSLIESTDSLVAICTALDSQESWLQAGQAMGALWLRATRDGLSVVPLTQVIEVEETRHALHHDIFAGMARPQILLRVGWQETTRPILQRTSRRPLDDVIQ